MIKIFEQVKPNLHKLNENQYLKETKHGFQIIYPVAKDVSKPFRKGNINYTNLILGGSWVRFITLLAILGLLFFSTWAYSTDLETCRKIIASQNKDYNPYFDYTLNLSLYNTSNNDFNISIPAQDNAQERTA